MTLLLGLDPSLRNTGVVILDPSSNTITHVNVIRTEKQADRLNLRVGEDDIRRAETIHEGLCRVVDEHDPVALFGELPGGSQSSRVAKGFGLVTGVLGAFLRERQLPAAWATQAQLKKACTGKLSSNKEDVEAFVQDHYAWRAELPSAKTRRSHVFDAAGALYALRDSDIYRMATQGVSR